MCVCKGVAVLLCIYEVHTKCIRSSYYLISASLGTFTAMKMGPVPPEVVPQSIFSCLVAAAGVTGRRLSQPDLNRLYYLSFKKLERTSRNGVLVRSAICRQLGAI